MAAFFRKSLLKCRYIDTEWEMEDSGHALILIFLDLSTVKEKDEIVISFHFVGSRQTQRCIIAP